MLSTRYVSGVQADSDKMIKQTRTVSAIMELQYGVVKGLGKEAGA